MTCDEDGIYCFNCNKRFENVLTGFNHSKHCNLQKLKAPEPSPATSFDLSSSPKNRIDTKLIKEMVRENEKMNNYYELKHSNNFKLPYARVLYQ